MLPVVVAFWEVTMQLHMHSHQWEHRLPDWPAAAVSGFVAGAVLMVLELLWTTNVIGSSSWSTSHKIAAIVMGQDALQSIDPPQLRVIHLRFQADKRAVQRPLATGPEILQAISQRSRQRFDELYTAAQKLAPALAQADADVATMG